MAIREQGVDRRKAIELTCLSEIGKALRDLVRQRAAAKADESRAKHRLVKHLLRHGLREPDESRAWTHPWWRWVKSLKFDYEAQKVAFADCTGVA